LRCETCGKEVEATTREAYYWHGQWWHVECCEVTRLEDGEYRSYPKGGRLVPNAEGK